MVMRRRNNRNSCTHKWAHNGVVSHSDELDSWTNIELRCTSCGVAQQYHPLEARRVLEAIK